MRILKFNEAIVDWETDNIKGFYQDLLKIISNERRVDFDKVKSIGDKYDVEIVDYDTFHSELPNYEMRKDAPPKGSIPVFGLVNPNTHKARLVIQVTQLDRGLLQMAYHMLKHENIHVGQMKRKKDKSKGEFLGDIRDMKAYFSNKDEVMAFSQSVVDMIMDKNPKSLEEAKSELKYVRLWSDIKRNVDDKTKKRYIKYIYLYLEKEFEKLGIEDKRKPFPSKDKPSTEIVKDISKDVENIEIESEIDNMIKKAKTGVLTYKEYNDLFDDIFDKIQSTDNESKKIHLAEKLKKLNDIMNQEFSKERSGR